MTASFNLVSQGFIPCLFPDGRRELLGLRDTLARAHEIREIRDDSPLVTVSLHRLLLAILHRNFGPKSMADWAPIWNAGRFDADKLDAYFEKWADRFDLLSATHPFYQTAGMSTRTPQPPASLFDERAIGNNATLFDHSQDLAGTPMTLGTATTGIVVRQAFAIGFGKSPNCSIHGRNVVTGYRTDAPLTRGLLVLILGNTVFETLLLNFASQSPPRKDHIPLWEAPGAEARMQDSHPTGRLDLYTWQSRRLRLVPTMTSEGTVVVEGVHFAQGRALAKEVPDGMKPYLKKEDGTWAPLGLSPSKAIWRDSAAVLELTGPASRPAAAVSWCARLVDQGLLPAGKQYRLAMFGLAADPGRAASLLLWRHEVLPLPLAYLTDQELLTNLRSGIALAEDVGKALAKSIRRLAEIASRTDASVRADRERVDQLAASLQAGTKYWSRLEEPFRHFLVELPGEESHRKARLCEWARLLQRAAHSVFNQIIRGLDDSPRMLKAIYESGAKTWGAEKTLAVQLAKLVQNYTPQEQGEPT